MQKYLSIYTLYIYSSKNERKQKANTPNQDFSVT